MDSPEVLEQGDSQEVAEHGGLHVLGVGTLITKVVLGVMGNLICRMV